MLFCRPLETTCRAENEFKVLPRLFQQLNRLLWKKFVGVYIDNSRTIFESHSKFIAKIKKTLNGVRSHCVTHRETLSFTYYHES